MNIRKQLTFLYRYATASYRRRKWLNTQVLMVLAASLVFFAAMLWTAPYSVHGARARTGVGATPGTAATPYPAQTQALTLTANPSAGPTRTPFPPEYQNNSQETIGITFAGAVLVLIVIIGVSVYMPKHPEK